MSATPWIVAADGSGDEPFGFVCHGCDTRLPIAPPLPLKEYIEAAKDFRRRHRKCGPEKARPRGRGKLVGRDSVEPAPQSVALPTQRTVR